MQVIRTGSLGQSRSQAASLPDRCCDVVLGPVACLVVLLIGQQMLGQFGPSQCGADDAVASQADLQALPVHRAATQGKRIQIPLKPEDFQF